MSTTEEQFDNTVSMIDYILRKFVAINLRISDDTLLKKKFAIIFVATASFDLGSFLWLALKARTGITFQDCDYIPKLIICIMSSIKIIMMSNNEVALGKLLTRLKEKLKGNRRYISQRTALRDRIKKELASVNMIAKIMFYNSICTLSLFMISPIIFMPYYYITKGELVIYTPMAVSYLFCDSFDLVGWIIAYFHTAIKGSVTIAGFSCDLLVLGQLSLLHGLLTTLATRLRENTSSLRSLIIEHQELLQLSHELDVVLSKSMLCFFTGSTFLICFTAFIISTVNENLLSFVLLLSLYICLIFMINYFGNKITEASLEVAHAIYERPWYQSGEDQCHHRQAIYIMIIRSQRPCALTVYKFATVSIHTFTKVLSSAWSYFALLRTFYTKE